MPKFFVTKENIYEGIIKITGEDVSHIRRVLRMKEGEELNICNSNGMDYTAVIDNINENEIICKITKERKSDTEPEVKVTLFQGIPKASKMDYIIQKTTELGVNKIIPCELNRCVAKVDGDKKIKRWQKIAEEAAKQSGRGIIPEIYEQVNLDKAIAMMKSCDLAFFPYECEERNNIKDILKGNENAKTVAYMIGPEGGFDIKEAEKLSDAGIIPVSLGKRILRTETAGEAVLAMIMYEIGDINKTGV